MAFHKVIEHDHAMAAVEQDLRTDASDVAGSPGHKNIQKILRVALVNGKFRVYSGKSKSAEQVLYLLCGAFTYKLCASNVFPVRMFQQFPPVRSPDSVKLI
jgi:hypothetical protein